MVLVEPLRRALAALEARIQAAFVYGFEAADPEREVSLMIIADDVSSPELVAALGEAEAVLGRPIEPVLFTPAEWRARLGGDEGFARRLAALPKIFLIGTEDSLA